MTRVRSTPYFFRSSEPVPDEIRQWGDRMRMLMDCDWLISQLHLKTEEELSNQLGVATKTLRKALRYHGIAFFTGPKKD